MCRVDSVVVAKYAISSKTRYSRASTRRGRSNSPAAAAAAAAAEEEEERREEDKNIAGDTERETRDERGVVVHVAGEAAPPEGKKAVRVLSVSVPPKPPRRHFPSLSPAIPISRTHASIYDVTAWSSSSRFGT